MSAIDDLLLASFVIGAHGAFAGTADAPAPMHRAVPGSGEGRSGPGTATAHAHAALVRATIYGVRNYPSALKEAINMMGRRVGRTRSPLTPLTPPEKDRLRAILKRPVRLISHRQSGGATRERRTSPTGAPGLLRSALGLERSHPEAPSAGSARTI